jgi:hypothetical protein
MRPLLAILIATAALAAALSASALAKGTATAARVCGANGCNTVDLSSLPALVDGVPARPPATPAPFVTLRTTVQYGPDAPPRTIAYDYLPSLGITRPSGSRDGSQWVRVSDEDRALLDHAIAPFEPYPPAQLARAAPPAAPAQDGGTAWWPIAGGAAAALALLALVARYATSAVKARPRASKSAN